MIIHVKVKPNSSKQKIENFGGGRYLVNIKCYRSYGTSSRGTIARCHALNKIMQKAIGIKAVYVLEFLTERFEKMDNEEKLKVIIHELMHIPKSFGGGFKHHNFVTERNVNRCYAEYKKRKEIS